METIATAGWNQFVTRRLHFVKAGSIQVQQKMEPSKNLETTHALSKSLLHGHEQAEFALGVGWGGIVIRFLRVDSYQ